MTLQDIALELGLDKFPEAEREQMLTMLYQTFHKRLGVRLSEELSHEQLEKFNKVAAEDPQGANEELARMLPNLAVREDIMSLLPKE
jgi:hypothetical protein